MDEKSDIRAMLEDLIEPPSSWREAKKREKIRRRIEGRRMAQKMKADLRVIHKHVCTWRCWLGCSFR